MTTQPDLFNYAASLSMLAAASHGFTPPFQRSSATSKAAAVAMRTKAPSQRERVLAYIKAQGAHGATREEIADALGMRLASVCGRVNKLLSDEFSGAWIDGTRKGSSGQPQEVVRA